MSFVFYYCTQVLFLLKILCYLFMLYFKSTSNFSSQINLYSPLNFFKVLFLNLLGGDCLASIGQCFMLVLLKIQIFIISILKTPKNWNLIFKECQRLLLLPIKLLLISIENITNLMPRQLNKLIFSQQLLPLITQVLFYQLFPTKFIKYVPH